MTLRRVPGEVSEYSMAFHRIVRLEDTDGDGRFDKQSVFADRMMFTEGVMWHAGSVNSILGKP